MKEYIEIPGFFDISKIDSFFLEEFLNSVEIVDGRKIPISELKDYYLEDPSVGLDVIFELKLRGFTFHVEKEDIFLQFVELPSDPEIVYTGSDANKIAEIDKSFFGCFDYDKSVKSDFYFNLIPVVSFKNIMDNYSYSYIKHEFQRYGFKIVKQSELKNLDMIPKKIRNHMESIESGSNILKFLNSEYAEDMKDFKIRDIFKGSEFRLFNEYCEDKNIESIYDLEEEDLSDFFKAKGMTEETVHAVNHKFKRIYNNINKTMNLHLKDNYRDSVLLVEHLKGLSKEKIELYESIELSSFIPRDEAIYREIFNRFKRNGYNSLYDVLAFNTNTMKKIDGMKRENIDRIMQLVSERKEEADAYLMNRNKMKFVLDTSAYNRISNMTLEEVVKDLEGPLTSVKDSIKDEKISKYHGKIYKNIEKENRDVYKVLRYIDLEIFKLYLPAILRELRYLKRDEEKYFIIFNRVKSNKSFEEIGSKLGKDENIVEGIFDSSLKKINKVLKENRFITSLKYNMGDRTGFRLEELEINLIDEFPLIVDLVRNNKIDDLNYYEVLDKVYYFNIDANLKAQNEGFKKLDRFGTIEEMFRLIDDTNVVKAEILFEDFKLISNSKGISFWEDYYYYKDLNKKELFEMYLKYIHREPFVLDREGAEKINSFAKDRLGIRIGVDVDSFGRLVEENPLIVKLDSNEYGHIYNYNVNNDTLGRIREILEEMLSTEQQVYLEEIYIELEKIYPNAFLSLEHLHSIIKLYFDDEYNIYREDGLSITKKGEDTPLNTDILYGICKEIGPVVKYTDIMEITRWPKSRIDITIINSKEIIKLGSDRCVIINDIISDDVKNRLKEIVDEMFYKGYNTSANIYMGEIIFDPMLSNFLDKYDIKEPKDISALIKYLYDDIDGDTNFLYKTDQTIRNIEDAIRYEFDSHVYREEIEEFIYPYGYSTTMLNQILDNLLARGMYVQVDDNLYSTKDRFVVKDEVKKELLNYVDEFMVRNGYVIPSRLVADIRNKFEDIEHGWNQHTIYSILSEFGYKKLYRHSIDYGSEILVLVEGDSYYESLDELVLDILKKDYTDIMHEENIYNFLVEKGFYSEKEVYCKGSLMNDLKYRDYIIVDGLGNVSLKE